MAQRPTDYHDFRQNTSPGTRRTIRSMNSVATSLISMGGLLLLALVLETFGRRTRLPRISLLVMLGFLLGPSSLEIIEPTANGGFEFVATLALSMVGFLVGGKLSFRLLHRVAKLVLWLWL